MSERMEDLEPLLKEWVRDAVEEALAAVLGAQFGKHEGLVDAKTLAGVLGVTPGWVREHAIELGGRRLGAGPKAPWRFDVAGARDALACSSSERSVARAVTSQAASRPGRRRSSGTAVPLLPIRGR